MLRIRLPLKKSATLDAPQVLTSSHSLPCESSDKAADKPSTPTKKVPSDSECENGQDSTPKRSLTASFPQLRKVAASTNVDPATHPLLLSVYRSCLTTQKLSSNPARMKGVENNIQQDLVFALFIETEHRIFETASIFASQVAEARCRTLHVHEFHLTCDSVRSATALGWTAESIVARLKELSCTQDPSIMEQFSTFVHVSVQDVAKVRLVLTDCSAYDCHNDDEKVSSQRLFLGGGILNFVLESSVIDPLQLLVSDPTGGLSGSFNPPRIHHRAMTSEECLDGVCGGDIYFLILAPGHVERVKKAVVETYHIPLENRYDYTCDKSLADVPHFTLKTSSLLRCYQRDAVASVFAGKHARSGMIVLPCGAGKSLTGVAVASRIAKRTLVLCVNTVSVHQWKEQFLTSTSLTSDQITILTSSIRQFPGDVVLTTYNQLTFADERRSDAARMIVEELRQSTWGTIIFDEVHVAPAATFRTIVDIVKGNCLLGLTATLLREDEKVEDLTYLIGPRLFECGHHKLTEMGFLAPVKCIEVHTPLPTLFQREYLSREKSDMDQVRLYNMNPTKVWCTQALLSYHESLIPPDKIIIFSECVAELEFYAYLFGRPFLSGKTPPEERETILAHFKNGTQLNTILLSRVGDAALDMPNANVIIQISSFFGQRRAEVQRLGRIQRPKTGVLATRNAYFYSLVTPYTREQVYASKRQRFLLDQGFEYNALTADRIISRRPGPRPHYWACVGFPTWRRGGSPVEPHVALALEFAYTYGRATVHVGADTTVRMFESSTDTTAAESIVLPPVTTCMKIGPEDMERGAQPGHCCGEECLTWYLSYINSEHYARGDSYITFCREKIFQNDEGSLQTVNNTISKSGIGKQRLTKGISAFRKREKMIENELKDSRKRQRM